ncbi:MAG TPA: class I SAM-dependent methyltransferase, partial [Gaiellaceae bacterium]|nr:class I SAM-dependent methyltransferase [Gaiellaceae bacterium]
MERHAGSTRFLTHAAALSRIEEVGAQMTSQETARGSDVQVGQEPKAVARSMWALGDYHAFAKQTVWLLGPELVQACGVSAGQRVLDVAAGSGNTAIRAAEAGARVVASDLTPENFEAGRQEAHALGVELEWVEADAESLPFEDGEFDVVTS